MRHVARLRLGSGTGESEVASKVKRTLTGETMSNTKPFTDAHAIVLMDVGVSFKEPIPRSDLIELCEQLRESLTADGFVESQNGCDGEDKLILNLERLDSDGDAVEVVHVHESHVHYVSHEYRGWGVSRDIAISRLGHCFVFMAQCKNRESRLTLSFQDAFIGTDPKKYRPEEVFKGNDYLPKAVLDGRSYWRVQLTLDEKNGQPKSRDWSRIFSRLTVNARVVDMESSSDEEMLRHLTTISHRQQIVVPSSVTVRVAWTAESVRRRLDVMHRHNADLMGELLSPDMRSVIGLKGHSYEL